MAPPLLGGNTRFNDLLTKAYEKKRGISLNRMPERYVAMAMRRVDSLDTGYTSCAGRSMLMLASNNYLGLAADERVTGAGLTALREWGNSTSGSRLLNGTNHMHIELERKLAEFKGTEASAVFPSGYMANLGVLSALLNEGDYVVMDKLAHASIIDGIKLTGAVLRTFKHQDMESLEKVLNSIPDGSSVLIAIDGIYSMDGDFAKLPEIVAMAKKFGAKIMIDDAHSTGVAGPNGRGTADHFAMEEVDIVTGTLSKALGCIGGFVAGKKDMVEFIKYNARSFIYSTSLSPSTTASLITAVDIATEESFRRANLWKVTNYLREGLQAQGYNTGPSESPIIPVIMEDDAKMFEMVIGLDQDDIFASPVIYPACPKKEPRVRISLNAEHSIADMDKVLDSFERHGRRLGMQHWSRNAYLAGHVARA